MGLAEKNQKFLNFEIFPIKKTTPLKLISFNKNLKDLKSYAEQTFSNKVTFPGLGKLTTRAMFLKEIEKEINKNE